MRPGGVGPAGAVSAKTYSAGVYFRRISAAVIPHTQRFLVLFKPDAFTASCIPEALKLLGQGLARERITFRFVAPTQLTATPELIDALYAEHVGKDWYNQIFKPFMTGQHPDPRVPKAPLLAVMVEVQRDPRRDLMRIIRERIIGPTDPESAADPASISETLRYKLTVGKGLAVWPLGDDPLSPPQNRLHCSTDFRRAGAELFAIYGSGELLTPYYQPDALELVLESFWQTGTPPPAARTPVHFPQMGHLFAFQDRLFHALCGAEWVPIIGGESQPAKPRVIVLFGAPGSGKTTVANLLRTRGIAQALVPLIVNEEREVDGAPEYQLRPKEEILAGIQEGRYLGWEMLPGSYYAVDQGVVDQILNSPGKTFVIIAGPNVVYPLQEALGDRADFYQVLVRVPDAELSARVAARATVRDAARGAALSVETQRWLTDDVGGFDLVVENSSGQAGQAAEEVGDFLLRPIRAAADPVRRSRTLLGMHLFHLLELFRERWDQIDWSDIEQAEAACERIAYGPLKALYEEARRSLPEPTDPGKPIATVIEENVKHTILVRTAGLQLRHQSYEDLIRKPRRMGKIGLANSAERSRRLYDRLKEIQARIPEVEEAVFDSLHDVGKVESIAYHPEKGAEIAERFRLFEGWGIPEIDPELSCLAIRHSHLIGAYVLPDYSITAVADDLNEPKTRRVLAHPDGRVNLAKVRMLLDRISLFPCKDTSGYEDGWLRVILAEGYLDFADWLYGIFERNQGSFDAAIREIRASGPATNRHRIAGLIAIEDMDGALHGRSFDHYWNEIIEPRVRDSIAAGLFTREDWSEVMANLHHIRQFRYATLSISDFLLFIGSQTQAIDDINNNVFKLLVLMTKALKAFSTDPANPDDCEFRFVDRDHQPIVNYGKFGPAMEVFNNALNLSVAELTSEGGRLTIGPQVEISLDEVEGRKTITFKLLNYSLAS